MQVSQSCKTLSSDIVPGSVWEEERSLMDVVASTELGNVQLFLKEGFLGTEHYIVSLNFIIVYIFL